MKATKIFIPSSKGKIAAVIHYTEHGSKGLAILCPGFLDSKDYPHLVQLADSLTGLGYTAVRFDPTGTWESDGDIADYTNTQYLADVKSVLEYMATINTYTFVLLGGHSRGGQISILYAAQDPRISAVLAIMPSSGKTFTNKRRTIFKEQGFKTSKRDLPNNKEQYREFRVPYSHVEDRDKYNVMEEVKKVRVPILFFAGEKDDLVLPEDVRLLFINANEPKQFTLLEGLGHDYRLNEEEITIVNKHILKQLSVY